MRALMLSLGFGSALLFGLGLAGAQEGNLASPDQKSAQERAQHGEDGRAGAVEPSTYTEAAKAAPTGVLVNGRLAVPGAPADSQTVPSTQSSRNAALDALPTMAFPVPQLTDEQKRRIRDAVRTVSAAVAPVRLAPADELPVAVVPRDLPAQLTGSIPALRNLGFVRAQDRILLVVPASRIVVGEIPN